MSVKPPKAEVARRRWHFRYVPEAEVAMPAQEPFRALATDIASRTFLHGLAQLFYKLGPIADIERFDNVPRLAKEEILRYFCA